MEKKIRLETLTCPSCVVKIEKGVGQMSGVESVNVGFNTSTVTVIFDEKTVDSQAIETRIKDLGFEVR